MNYYEPPYGIIEFLKPSTPEVITMAAEIVLLTAPAAYLAFSSERPELAILSLAPQTLTYATGRFYEKFGRNEIILPLIHSSKLPYSNRKWVKKGLDEKV